VPFASLQMEMNRRSRPQGGDRGRGLRGGGSARSRAGAGDRSGPGQVAAGGWPGDDSHPALGRGAGSLAEGNHQIFTRFPARRFARE
jgi:hypothetical protein